MDAILQTVFFKAFSSMKIFIFFIKISLQFDPKGPVDNNPALFLMMAWCQIGNKPLSYPVVA